LNRGSTVGTKLPDGRPVRAVQLPLPSAEFGRWDRCRSLGKAERGRLGWSRIHRRFEGASVAVDAASCAVAPVQISRGLSEHEVCAASTSGGLSVKVGTSVPGDAELALTQLPDVTHIAEASRTPALMPLINFHQNRLRIQTRTCCSIRSGRQRCEGVRNCDRAL